MGRARTAARFPWRWVWEAPLVLAVSFCLLGAGFAVTEIAHGVRTANRVHLNVTRAKAMIAAEQASFLVAAGPDRPLPGQVVPVGGGFTCRIAAIDSPNRITLRVAGPRGSVHGFACDLLPGGAPGVFGVPFGLTRIPEPETDGPRMPRQPLQLSPGDLPQLEPLPEDARTGARGLVVRDNDLGLLRLASGTDLEDWVLCSAAGDYLEPAAPPSGVVRLQGHLWLDAGRRPVHLRLHRNLTIVVEGNLYLGSSVLVSGPGRLVLVAAAGRHATFRDLDGNGRWSAGDELLSGDEEALQGCVEGAGAIWLGLPGDARADDLRVEAGLFAEGEIQVTASRVVVRGPLIGAQGASGTPGSELTVTGEHLPDVHRERIPGFEVQGPPRPGPLVPVSPAPVPRASR